MTEAIPTLNSAERAEVDPFITEHGRGAIVHYIATVKEITEEELVLKYLKYLVSQGADVNAKKDKHDVILPGENRSGVMHDVTPLHLAILMNNTEIVKLLVTKEADVNAKAIVPPMSYPTSVTPLHIAAQIGNLEVVKLLVAKGADVNAEARQDITPLFLAVSHGGPAVAEYLYSMGARMEESVNSVDSNLAGHIDGVGVRIREPVNLVERDRAEHNERYGGPIDNLEVTTTSIAHVAAQINNNTSGLESEFVHDGQGGMTLRIKDTEGNVLWESDPIRSARDAIGGQKAQEILDILKQHKKE